MHAVSVYLGHQQQLPTGVSQRHVERVHYMALFALEGFGNA